MRYVFVTRPLQRNSCPGFWAQQLSKRTNAGDGPPSPAFGFGCFSLDRPPDWPFPVSPAVVPRDLSPRRPRRRRRWRRRPRRRTETGATRTITSRATVVVVPVAAVVPILVRAPTVVPLVAGAPVVVVHRGGRGRRLGDSRGQPQSGQGHAATYQRTGAQAKPRRCLRVSSHAGKGFPEKII